MEQYFLIPASSTVAAQNLLQVAGFAEDGPRPSPKGSVRSGLGNLLKDHIKPVAQEAGLPNIGWHSFRHTVSAWGKEEGLELEDVKTLLRHENIATTSNVYGDIGLVAKRRIQERLVEFVKQQAATDTAQRDALWQQTHCPPQILRIVLKTNEVSRMNE